MNQKKVFLSVVMPIYNVEKHLRKAIDSVISQTFNNFEIILVDDCSPDSCSEICDEYAGSESRISVVHLKENGGLSNARNVGIDKATGEYIFFMDSDDYIDNTLFENVYNSVTKNKADVIVFGLEEDYFNSNEILSKKYVLTYGKELLINNVNDLRKEVIHLEDKTFYGYAWNKIYNLSVIKNNNLKFETITLIEDIVFNVNMFNFINSLNILNIAPYHYLKRIDQSLTNKYVPDYFKLHKKRVSMIYSQYENWNCNNNTVKEILADIYARYIFSALQRNCDKRSAMNFKDRKVWIKSLITDDLFCNLAPFMKSSGLLGILEHNLKSKNVILCLVFGRIIFIIKDRFPILFASIKQKK